MLKPLTIILSVGDLVDEKQVRIQINSYSQIGLRGLVGSSQAVEQNIEKVERYEGGRDQNSVDMDVSQE